MHREIAHRLLSRATGSVFFRAVADAIQREHGYSDMTSGYLARLALDAMVFDRKATTDGHGNYSMAEGSSQ